MSVTCALCPALASASWLSFRHVRQGKEVRLDVPLCESHGNQIEKHIKRRIPGRYMEMRECGNA